MDRITTEKRDGSDELAGSCEAISSGPPGSNRVIPFPRSAAAALSAEGSEGAGVSSASASSFVSLGAVTHAVVLRLRGGFPRLSVLGGAGLGGGEAAPPGQSAPGEGTKER